MYCYCKYAYDIDQNNKKFSGAEIEKIISYNESYSHSNLTHGWFNDTTLGYNT
jgi:hypothetical protein